MSNENRERLIDVWNTERGYRPSDDQNEEDSCSEKPNDWVSVVERMPTAEDADEDGMILGRGTRGIGPYHYAAARVIDGSLPEFTFTHWAPLKKEEG